MAAMTSSLGQVARSSGARTSHIRNKQERAAALWRPASRALVFAPCTQNSTSWPSIACRAKGAAVGIDAMHAAEEVPPGNDDSVDSVGVEGMDHIMATFRWPAALGGREVAVVGKSL